jgi:hypothetical protein
MLLKSSISGVGISLLLAVSPEHYEMCRSAGALLAPDSPALAKNWTPESGLDPPPWYDIDGNEIEYIGACPAAAQEVEIQPPNPPQEVSIIE